MPPEHIPVFGAGATETTVHPVVLIATVIAIVLIFLLPRKYVILPLLCIALLVPVGPVLVAGGLHFSMLRVVVLLGSVRILLANLSPRNSIFAGGWNSIDQAFCLYLICQALAIALLFRQTGAVLNDAGTLCDFLGGYFLLRLVIQNEEDVYRLIKCLALVSVILAIGMLIEQWNQVNIFGLIGGTNVVPELRDGRIRSEGAFAHELLAGTFGATSLPLFILLWKNGKAKVLAAIGVVAATIITWTAGSSTALTAYAAGILALCFWPLRRSMRKVRWGIVIALGALQLFMKAPFWFVIAHIDLTGSSSSYHRAEVVDQFIRHFSDWWLIGTYNTGSWGWDMWDAQNQYVSVGETGGLLALFFFIAMLSRCFARLGNARTAVEGDRQKEWLLWILGAALFSHVVGFLGVNYFDQSRVSWFALLVLISVVTAPILQVSPAPEPQVDRALTGSRLAYASRSGVIANGSPYRREHQFQSRP